MIVVAQHDICRDFCVRLIMLYHVHFFSGRNHFARYFGLKQVNRTGYTDGYMCDAVMDQAFDELFQDVLQLRGGIQFHLHDLGKHCAPYSGRFTRLPPGDFRRVI